MNSPLVPADRGSVHDPPTGPRLCAPAQRIEPRGESGQFVACRHRGGRGFPDRQAPMGVDQPRVNVRRPRLQFRTPPPRSLLPFLGSRLLGGLRGLDRVGKTVEIESSLTSNPTPAKERDSRRLRSTPGCRLAVRARGRSGRVKALSVVIQQKSTILWWKHNAEIVCDLIDSELRRRFDRTPKHCRVSPSTAPSVQIPTGGRLTCATHTGLSFSASFRNFFIAASLALFPWSASARK